MVLLRRSPEYVEGEIIAVLPESRYKVKWTTGLGYRDRVTIVLADEIRKKP